jgi:hypothetical protein
VIIFVFLKKSILQDVKYCGGDTPPDFFSVGRSVELVFHTDASGGASGKGFKIEYKAAGNKSHINYDEGG